MFKKVETISTNPNNKTYILLNKQSEIIRENIISCLIRLDIVYFNYILYMTNLKYCQFNDKENIIKFEK